MFVSYHHATKCTLSFYKYTVTLHQPMLYQIAPSWRSHSQSTRSLNGNQDEVLRGKWDKGGFGERKRELEGKQEKCLIPSSSTQM